MAVGVMWVDSDDEQDSESCVAESQTEYQPEDVFNG